jgi:hypothetical protein
MYRCWMANGAQRWPGQVRRKDFSVISGRLFEFHKMVVRHNFAVIAIFCNEVKGKSALALFRYLDRQCETALIPAHKLREVMTVKRLRTLTGFGDQS